MEPVSKQRIYKYASKKTGLLLETVIAIRFMQSGYKENNWDNLISRELNPAREAEKRWR
jgi:hypothetical protein